MGIPELLHKHSAHRQYIIQISHYYGDKAIENAFEFKEMVEVDKPLSKKEQQVKQRVSKALAAIGGNFHHNNKN
jgi:hypothetical protein